MLERPRIRKFEFELVMSVEQSGFVARCDRHRSQYRSLLGEHVVALADPAVLQLDDFTGDIEGVAVVVRRGRSQLVPASARVMR